MKIRIATLLAAAVLLSACTDQDWDRALSYTGMSGSHGQSVQPAAAAQPAATGQPTPMAQAAPAPVVQTAPQPNAFCEAVASQDAQRSNFDPPTQQRMFVQTYRQCVVIFGDAAK